MKKKRSLFMLVALLFALGLLTVSVALAGNGPSLATNPSPATGTNNQAPAIATGGSITITHSTSQVITVGNSVSCNAGGLHTDNSYYRVFDLANDFGIVDTFDVTAVQYGIEQATSATTQPIQVRLYTLNGAFTLANLTAIGNTTDNISSQSGTIYTSLVNGTVPPNGILVVEVFSPNGQAANNSFFIGSNAAGQSDPSYLRAADCGLSQPAATGSIGFPNMHIVINVIGNEASAGLPSIALTKTVGTDPASCATTTSISADYGSTVYYCYTVENTGNVTLTHHTVTDSVLGTVLGPGFVYNLAPSASAFITESYVLMTDTITNDALWTAYISGTNTVATATASATVTGLPTDVSLSSIAGQTSSSFILVALMAGLVLLAGAVMVGRRQQS
ncbi:MAG: hypothetical protein IPL78_01825 [Chloroflexi bacterium]|nr:hypothetical protein [Chloroflexota bacterium]